ncbi:MAG: glycosyltransferase family 9 protein [Thermodesulfobacteriota bacterium]
MPEKKLLIIHQGALGDFVMTFPILIGLRRIYSKIDALCQKKLGELARELNLIDGSHALESAAVAPLYSDNPENLAVATASLLRSYERIVLFSFSRKLQGSIERLSGANVLRIPPRPPVEENVHVGRFLREHFIAAGLIERGNPSPSDFVKILQRQRACGPNAAPVLIHPGSGSRKKNWPLKNFILIEKMLRKDGLRAEFILGPADIHLKDGLGGPHAPSLNVHIVDDLLRALSLMKSACGFIGNDSGLSQLAAILGLPVAVVFGPSDPVRWKPLGPAVAVVRPATDCRPCHETGEPACASPDCFKGISPRMVYAAFSCLNKGFR